MTKTTKELLEDRLKEVNLEIEAIEKDVKPLRDERNKLQATIQPVEDRMRELAHEIREVEQPRLSELRAEKSALAKALGSKSMRADGAVTQGA